MTQRPTGQLQLWVGWLPDPASLLSVGYAAQTGGRQQIDGTPNGLKTESQSIRVSYQRFLSASFQVAVVLQRDVAVSGGFKEAFGSTLRLIYLY